MAQKESNQQEEKQNPLLCNPEDGVCATPRMQDTSVVEIDQQQTHPIKIIYFTDPICSSCWGIEPQLRKIKLAYGHDVKIEYHMGGLLPDWSYNSGGISKPSDVAHHWDEVSSYYEMPIDGDVWLEDPLDSSYPPSIAFKAAQMQNEEKALKFLRRIREMVFLEKKNITKWSHIKEAALENDLDTTQLKSAIDGFAKQAFQNDLTLAKSMGVRGFPTLYVQNQKEEQAIVYGARPYEEMEKVILKLNHTIKNQDYEKTPENLFEYYPTMTIKEFQVLSEVNKAKAIEVLEGLVQAGNVEKFVTKNGDLYKWKK